MGHMADSQQLSGFPPPLHILKKSLKIEAYLYIISQGISRAISNFIEYFAKLFSA
jgi:hypothetical protein